METIVLKVEVSIVLKTSGRVFLNIINNGFSGTGVTPMPIEDYIKQITVSTQKIDNNLQVTIEDNGIGIPDEIKDKVFSAIFTTKKRAKVLVGLGFTFGLHIGHKGHGGTIEVNSIKNQGTICD
jgi:signal transduction histidine kinase